jgi:hypothetical protein
MYRLEVTHRAQHSLGELSKQDFERIIAAIRSLREKSLGIGEPRS